MLIDTHIASVAAKEWTKVLSILTSELRDLSLAEEMTQEAFVKAIEQWPASGVPQRPGAWLLTVARRGAIDRLRRASVGREKTAVVARLEQSISPAATAVDTSLVRDEQLQLIFACCHPALSLETQLALVLRCVLGLSTKSVAHAFVVSEATMAQRLVRGKRKIKQSAIPLHMPDDAVLTDRLAVVHSAIYLLYNQGYLSGNQDKDPLDVSSEAIRLARLLASLMPESSETKALLALLLLIESRSEAHETDKTIVLLADQDRTLWRWPLIDEAQHLLDQSLKLGKGGLYQLQAAIASLHCIHDPEATDWTQIELLYRSLITAADTPVVRLNHCVAVAMTTSPAQALVLLAPLEEALNNYHYYFSTKGELLYRNGQYDEARQAFERALSLTQNKKEKAFLRNQITKGQL